MISWNLLDISSGNGLSPVRCQAICWSNADSLWNGPLQINFHKIESKYNNLRSRKWIQGCHLPKISVIFFRPSVLTPEIPKGYVVYFVSQRTPTWLSTNDLHKWGKNKIWENISTWVPLCMYWYHHGGFWGPLQEKYQHYYVLVLEHNMTIKEAWPNIGWDAVWACNSSRANFAETELIENKRSSIWQLCHHWWHRKLS